MRIATVNPVDNKLVKKFKEVSDRTVQTYLAAASQELEAWRNTTFASRGKSLKDVADVLRNDKENYAQLMTLEMGKPIKESRAEIEKCAWVCEYFADNAKEFLKDDTIETDASHSYVLYEPLGIVMGIMPWNFPFWQVFRFAVPALMAGNVVLLKHAPNVPQCALAIQEVFRKANMHKGCFQSMLIGEKKARRLIEKPEVKMISLTGSDRAGASVASVAGKYIKKMVLELGGSDPFIVLEDANLMSAAEIGVKSRMMNGGQSCIAAKRFIVHETVKEEFVSLLKKMIGELKVGDPADEDMDMGPLAREDLAKKVYKQIRDSVKKGANVVTGGGRPKRKGAFVSPTLLTQVQPGMPAFDEEVFGPVASVIGVTDDDDAIACANNSVYGLGAAIWSEDVERANRLAKRLNCGSVFINELVKSDPRLPFGGMNRSGYGRELSYHGIREFTNVKTVWIA